MLGRVQDEQDHVQAQEVSGSAVQKRGQENSLQNETIKKHKQQRAGELVPVEGAGAFLVALVLKAHLPMQKT